MSTRLVVVLLIALAAPLVQAADLLLIDFDQLKLLDTETGVVVDVAPIAAFAGGMAICPSGRILVGYGSGVKVLDPVTYELTDFLDTGFGVRGLACTPDGTGYLIRNAPGPPGDPDWLYRFDAEEGDDLELVGITTNSALQALASDADGNLWGWAVTTTGAGLNRIDPDTAEVTHIGIVYEGVEFHAQWLDFDAAGQLWGGRETVSQIDQETGAFTLFADGFNDVRGAAFLESGPGPECFLVVGGGAGGSPFQYGPVGHSFTTQVDGIESWHPVLMEDIPEFVIGDLLAAPVVATRGLSSASTGPAPSGVGLDDGALKAHATPGSLAPTEFTVQVLMWNPQVFPGLPEQSTHGLAVRLFPTGRVVTVPYGESTGGMTIWAELDVNAAGQRVIRFPFDIPLM